MTNNDHVDPTPYASKVSLTRVEADLGALTSSVKSLADAVDKVLAQQSMQGKFNPALMIACIGVVVTILIAGMSKSNTLSTQAAVSEAVLETRAEWMSGVDEHIIMNRARDNSQDVSISSLVQAQDEATRRFIENEDDIERIESKAVDRYTGTQGHALEERVAALEALLGTRE